MWYFHPSYLEKTNGIQWGETNDVNIPLTLQALKEKVLSFELIKEVGVNDENCIAEDVAEN